MIFSSYSGLNKRLRVLALDLNFQKLTLDIWLSIDYFFECWVYVLWIYILYFCEPKLVKILGFITNCVSISPF